MSDMAAPVTDDTPSPSPGYRALEATMKRKAGIDLAEFVAARRADRLSWNKISLRIFELTGQWISYETLRTWFAYLEHGAA